MHYCYINCSSSFRTFYSMLDDQVTSVIRPSLGTFCSIQDYTISGERRVTISIYRLSPFSKAGQARILQHDTGRFSRHHETPVLQLHAPVTPDLHPERFNSYLTLRVKSINTLVHKTKRIPDVNLISQAFDHFVRSTLKLMEMSIVRSF